MSRSDGQSEARSPVFKSPSKLGTYLSTHHYRRIERDKYQPLHWLKSQLSLKLQNECVSAKANGDEQFIQTRRMPNSPSQMIPDMFDWRQIWGLGRQGKVVTVRRQSCDTLAVGGQALPC
ncbi:hypothetical protein TNCV_1893091 [Trichonephila clavipes]|nr:hypothetical protein TNCV_1893091 [Trichonephila clavipes]